MKNYLFHCRTRDENLLFQKHFQIYKSAGCNNFPSRRFTLIWQQVLYFIRYTETLGFTLKGRIALLFQYVTPFTFSNTSPPFHQHFYRLSRPPSLSLLAAACGESLKNIEMPAALSFVLSTILCLSFGQLHLNTVTIPVLGYNSQSDYARLWLNISV